MSQPLMAELSSAEEVFTLDDLGQDVFKRSYAYDENETWSEAADRVASHVAEAEEYRMKRKWASRFYSEIVSNRFMPGGRIIYGSGRGKAQLLNCFVISPDNFDSREGWGQLLKESIIISGTGGGIGINFSPIRPNGSEIKGTGGHATGPVSLMRMDNGVGLELVAGGGRRMAKMSCLDINHPDIEEFLNSKLVDGDLSTTNISVVLNFDPKEFKRLVEEDGEIDLEYDGLKTGKTIKAREFWNNLVKNAWENGEPGVLNSFYANKMSNIFYDRKLTSTNPCVTGHTLIAVADGRNAVSISQLTDEGVDVPVYCSDPNTGQTVIRMGRNPRKTGIKKEVWKLILDDGSELIATPDHKIMRRDGTYVELSKLSVGDSLRPFNSYESNGYRQIAESGATVGRGGHRRSRRQYRLIWENYNNPAQLGMEIHHCDFNQKNDRYENLKLLDAKEHRLLHSEKMLGKNNPYWKMSDEWKFSFASHPGFSNPKAIQVSNEELLEHGKLCWEQNGTISQSIWIKYAKKNKLPQNLANTHRFGTWTNFKLAVAGNHKVVSVEFTGYEDVYNITVDEHHNYQVITSHDGLRSSGICVKNCGEIWMSPYDCCCLGAIVLPRFVKDGELDWDSLENTIRIAVRFLDNVLTVNHYPLERIKETCDELRRIGLGVMGLHTMLLELGIKYSEGFETADKVMNFIKKVAYDTSINLAIEKGPFPAFRPEFCDSGFMKTMKPSIRRKVKKYGIRNCAILTVAPTGTTGIVSGVSTGIEPYMAPVYWRRIKMVDAKLKTTIKKVLVVEPAYDKFGDLVEGAADISVENHFKMQQVVQKHIDNAVSKTINLPNDYPVEELSRIWLDNIETLKGSTFYRWGSRENEPFQPVLSKDIPLVLDETPEDMIMRKERNENEADCVTGVCLV